MKNLYILAAIVLAALAAGACSVKENPVVDEILADKGKVVTLVATLGPKGGADTKALTDPGDGTLASAWAVNEEICVEYTDNGDNFVDAKGIVTAVDGDGKATVTVNLVDPKDGNTDIYFHYPYSIAKGIKDLTTDQIGTLDDIAANFDDFDGDGTLNVTGGVATLPSDVTMTRNVSIWKLAFKVGDSDITNSITALNINIGDGAREYDVTPSALDAIYVALGNVLNTNVTITAATPSGNYSFTKDDVTLTPGFFYRSTVTLTAAAASGTYREYSDRINFDNVFIPGGATTITSGTTTWAAGTYVVDNDVTISGDVTMTGNVNLILKDGVELEVIGCIFGGKDGEGYPNYAYSLNIYGQSMSTGKLTIRSNYANEYDFIGNNMEVHGGIISATNAFQAIETGGTFVIYHGTVTVDGSIDGIIAMENSGTAATIYGGTINASSSSEYGTSIHTTGGGLTISGGSVTATNTGNNSGIEVNGNLTVSGGVVTANGGADRTGINIIGGTISLTGVTMYEGDAANPATPAADQTACTKRYVIIQ